jgi:hypothetical protein
MSGDNLNNVRHEASRPFKNKKREYAKDKIDEPAMNSKNKKIRDLYREINEFKRVTNLLADSNNIVNTLQTAGRRLAVLILQAQLQCTSYRFVERE